MDSTERERRLVGVDLGIAGAHTAVVADETGRVLARRKCVPTRGSLEDLEAAALAGAAPDGNASLKWPQ